MCVRLTLNPLTQNYEIWHAESFFKTKTIESRVNDLAQSCILAYVQLGLKNSRHPTAYPCYQMPPFPTKTFFRSNIHCASWHLLPTKVDSISGSTLYHWFWPTFTKAFY